MNNLHHEVKKYFDILDQEEIPFTSYQAEFDIEDIIKQIIQRDHEYKPTEADLAEHMAFGFMPNRSKGSFGWGTYYGPMFVLPNQFDQLMEFPSIQRVDEKTLRYWENRAKQSTHPFLSSRYADLVVTFSPEKLNAEADIDLFKIVIDANIKICEKSLAHIADRKTKIHRALDLATQINDENRVRQAKDMKAQIEQEIDDLAKKGYLS